MKDYYWLIVVGVLAIAYIFLIMRQKRQEKRNLDALSSFKVGDRVITHIGIYGRIKRIYNTSYGKTCVLEIGTNNKVDIELDMRYIAGLDEKVATPDEPLTETTRPEEPKHEEPKEVETDKKEQPENKTKKQTSTKNKSKNKSNKG